MSIYLYLPFTDIFVQKNSEIFHKYMNRECFTKEDVNMERLTPNPKEEEYLLLSGKEGGSDIVYDNKKYTITCMMTVVVKKKYNEIWT